jgi:protein involved in polysaccharide export with SLBB domain
VIWKNLSTVITLLPLVVVATQSQNQHNPSVLGQSPTEIRNHAYSVTGKVNRPGSFELVKVTVYDAIVKAGGFRDGANKKDIQIFRGTQRLHFNCDDFLRGKNRDENKNIELEDGDLVHVE